MEIIDSINIYGQGLTHTAVTPLDLVKCRGQVDPTLYKSNLDAFRKIRLGEGVRGVFTGWGPTFFGYSVSHHGLLFQETS